MNALESHPWPPPLPLPTPTQTPNQEAPPLGCDMVLLPCPTTIWWYQHYYHKR
jgi:hypothetical protein